MGGLVLFVARTGRHGQASWALLLLSKVRPRLRGAVTAAWTIRAIPRGQLESITRFTRQVTDRCTLHRVDASEQKGTTQIYMR